MEAAGGLAYAVASGVTAYGFATLAIDNTPTARVNALIISVLAVLFHHTVIVLGALQQIPFQPFSVAGNNKWSNEWALIPAVVDAVHSVILGLVVGG